MDTEALAAFEAVAEHRGFGRAAAVLHVSQSTLSRRIAALERELGVELFARTTRSVVLTLAGYALLAHAPAVRSAVAAARRAAGPPDWPPGIRPPSPRADRAAPPVRP